MNDHKLKALVECCQAWERGVLDFNMTWDDKTKSSPPDPFKSICPPWAWCWGDRTYAPVQPKAKVKFSMADIRPGMVFRRKDGTGWQAPHLVGTQAIAFEACDVAYADLQADWLWSTDAANWHPCEKEGD